MSIAEVPSDDVSPLLSAAVRLPRESTLLCIDRVAALIASQLAMPEENRRSHWRSAVLATRPALAAREHAAMSEHEPERRRRLEALARELDAMTEAEAGAEARAEFERRINSENVGAWSWLVFEAIKAGRLRVRLRNGVRVPSLRSASTSDARGWVSAGDLAHWLEQEGFEVTHAEVAGADSFAASEPPAPAPWSAPIRLGPARVEAILAALRERGHDVQQVPLGLKSQLRAEFIESHRDLAFTASTFDKAWALASADGRLSVLGKDGYRRRG